MSPRSLLALIVILYSSFGTIAKADTQWRIERAGVRIVSATEQIDSIRPKRPFNHDPGVTVALKVSSADKKAYIFDIHADESNIDAVVDDTGVDWKAKSRYWPHVSLHSTGRYGLIQLQLDAPIPREVKTIMFKGTLSVNVAESSKRTMTRKIPLSKNAEFDLDGEKIKIEEVSIEKDRVFLTIGSKKTLNHVRFLSVRGDREKTFDVRVKGGSNSIDLENNESWYKKLLLIDGNVSASFQLEVEVLQSRSLERLPFEFTTPVSLD